METKRPTRWKMAAVAWVCIYPLITLMSLTIMPYLVHWPVAPRTLLLR